MQAGHDDSADPAETAGLTGTEDTADRASVQAPSDPWHRDNEKKHKGKIVFGVIAGLIVAAALIFWIIAGTKPEVDVLSNASLSSVSGYNGYGYLTSDSISSGLSAETLPEGVDNTAENRMDWATLISVLSYTPDKSYDLKNGDKIVITAGGNKATINSLADDLGIRIKGLGDSRTITVSGIRERFTNGKDVADHDAYTWLLFQLSSLLLLLPFQLSSWLLILQLRSELFHLLQKERIFCSLTQSL